MAIERAAAPESPARSPEMSVLGKILQIKLRGQLSKTNPGSGCYGFAIYETPDRRSRNRTAVCN